MAIVDNINEVLHHIRIRLYPNYLTNVKGAFIARTDNEATLSIEEICAALKNRGGFTGNYNDLVEYVKRFFDEAAYQLCDGFSVNTGYYSIHLNVGGTFDHVTERHDSNKHPVTFRFRVHAPLRALAEHIVVDVVGLADVSGYIAEFIDISTESVDEILTPGGMFSIMGHKIKIVGKDPDVGLYFVSATDAERRMKVVKNLAENTASKVIGIVPMLEAGAWKPEIWTQFSGYGSSGLKKPRVITGSCILTVPEPVV